MGFFSFIETFFFISLIITFVLLVMLIYHFKQRILKLEDKTNTLVEIVNDIVKEMKSASSLGNVVNNAPFGVQPQPSYQELHDNYEGIPENIKTILIETHDDIDSESDTESDSDSDVESDSDSESESESESINESVSESNLDEVNLPEIKLVEVLDSSLNLNIEPTLNHESPESTIKTISIDLGNDVLAPEVVLDNIVEPEVDLELTLDVVHDVEHEPESQSVSVLDTQEPTNITTEVLSNKKAIYENMAPSALKSMIVQRGLTSVDVSKMKKNKLVQILLDSDE